MGHNSLLDNTIGCFANEFFFLIEKLVGFHRGLVEITLVSDGAPFEWLRPTYGRTNKLQSEVKLKAFNVANLFAALQLFVPDFLDLVVMSYVSPILSDLGLKCWNRGPLTHS